MGEGCGEGREPVRSLGWAGWCEALKRLQRLAGWLAMLSERLAATTELQDREGKRALLRS